MRQRDRLQRLGIALEKASSFLDGFRPSRENAELQGVFHLGEAGGIAFEGSLPGIECDAFFLDISDAVETWDMPRVRRFHRHLAALAESVPERGRDRYRDDEDPERGNWECDWLQYGAAANEATEAMKAGDSHRVALMCGFVVGMMWYHPGPHSSRREFEEWVKGMLDWSESDVDVPPDTTYQGGTVADMVLDGYRENRLELLQWAVGRMGVGHRFSCWYPNEEDALMEYLEREERSIQCAQNFGLRMARRGDDSIQVPYSYGIQRTAVLKAVQERKEADNGSDEVER